MTRPSPYDGTFFDAISDASAATAARIAPFLEQLLHPASVVDIGCGTGAWLAAFVDLGVTDVLGIDGDYVDRSRLRIPTDRFTTMDLGRPTDVGRSFDLALCFEVAEHLEPAAGDRIVGMLTDLAPAIAFSAAIPGQGGEHHVNEQWCDYWIERFARRDFRSFDCLRARFWDDADVAPYYAQNALLFLREDHPASGSASAAVETFPQRIVHPGVFRQHTRDRGVGEILRELPRALRRSVAHRRARR